MCGRPFLRGLDDRGVTLCYTCKNRDHNCSGNFYHGTACGNCEKCMRNIDEILSMLPKEGIVKWLNEHSKP